ncbi:MAG: NAD(P)-dependent alcohol dehydrogenase [Verrucomicrobiota bacterium]
MRTIFKAYAAPAQGQPLAPFEFDPGPLRPEQVEVKVSHCGICHSDLSMIHNEWGQSTYPLVPGHEIVGTVVAAGDQVKRVKVGDRVGVGWFSGSCLACPQCLAGDHNLCAGAEQTMVGRPGGFADRVRANWEWATPLPAALDPVKVGPLFCGGITVFNPIVQCGVQPTDRVGVIGIGGLGHLALQFLNKWGCEVVAFTSTDAKREEALRLGAHRVVNSRNSGEMRQLAGSLDFILVTVNVSLDWATIIAVLAPRGRLHIVGAVLEPIPVAAFSLLVGQKSLSGSPVGSPATTAKMLEFCARHGVAPVIEKFPMSRVNDALEHLRAGQARYRIVLENDLG